MVTILLGTSCLGFEFPAYILYWVRVILGMTVSGMSWPDSVAIYKCPINTYPPSAAYMRQWIGSALVQRMACRLFGAEPLSKPMLGYCQLNPQEHISVKFQSKYNFFIHESASENFISGMAAILSRWSWVNKVRIPLINVRRSYGPIISYSCWFSMVQYSKNIIDYPYPFA